MADCTHTVAGQTRKNISYTVLERKCSGGVGIWWCAMKAANKLSVYIGQEVRWVRRQLQLAARCFDDEIGLLQTHAKQ